MLAANASAQIDLQAGLTLPQGFEGFDHVNGMFETFEQEVEERTDGAIEVELIYGGTLGSPTDRLSQVRRGTLQMSDVSEGAFATIYPEIQALSIPYLFPSEQAAWAFFESDFADQMAADILEQTGIRVLGWWEAGGFRHYSANTPIEEPEDMAGLRMRVMSPVFAAPVEAMGGSAVPVPFNELYTALQTGVVDGQDNAVNVFRLVSLYEVQDYLMLDGHVYSFGPLIINNEFYEGLSEDQQAAIQAAADAAIAYNREASRAGEAEALDAVQEEGVTVIEFSQEQKQELAEIAQPAVIAWLRDELPDPGFVDEVMEAAEAAADAADN
jgi:tripartite ATP-independent transporter DctP family solute receptor